MATGAIAVATTLAMMTTATTTDTSSTLSTRGPRKFRGYGFSEQRQPWQELLGPSDWEVSQPQLGLDHLQVSVQDS